MPSFLSPPSTYQRSFGFNDYAAGSEGLMDYLDVPYDVEPYQPPEDLLGLSAEFGLVLGSDPQHPEGLAHGMSTDVGLPAPGQHLESEPQSFGSEAYAGPQTSFPSYFSDLALPPSPPPVHYPPVSDWVSSQARTHLESLSTPDRHDPPTQTTVHLADIAPRRSTAQPTPVRRSTRQRTQVARPTKGPSSAKAVAKRGRRTKATPAPAQPVASGSNVQLPPRVPAVGMKERERATRRPREEVVKQLDPVPPRDCPTEGCERKFGAAREEEVAHLKEHYPGGLTKAKVPCLWTGCGKMVAGNTLVDHIGAKHLRVKYRCTYETCTWTSPRSGDLNQHLERKHRHAKRRLTEGDVQDKQKRRRT
ncbi:hypothetical protein PYCCODRAFT_1472605 [Trametes coccinea BRFM310]|uniref:C2H2-type domain-containing protein n=1 Tax=Trametes coccinea (strain BRFM310) TaxID=1353009 RepID=A0A1Y2I5N8_TRAC3|nr:hypothetical protein PYCCODRAFT_1472605 [Trametes coccinea BRFM310]